MLTMAVRCWSDYRLSLLRISTMLANRIFNIFPGQAGRCNMRGDVCSTVNSNKLSSPSTEQSMHDYLTALQTTSVTFTPVLAVFLCAQVPKGQHGHVCHDYEYLREAEGQQARVLLLWPQRAAGDGSPDAAVWPRCRLPLAAVAVLHAHRRRSHHHDGEAHAVPLQAVWGNWQDQEVKHSQQL